MIKESGGKSIKIKIFTILTNLENPCCCLGCCLIRSICSSHQLSSGSMKNCFFWPSTKQKQKKKWQGSLHHICNTELYRCYSLCAVAQSHLNGCHRVVCRSESCAMCIYSEVFMELLKLSCNTQTSKEPVTPKSNPFCVNLWALLQRSSMSPNYRQHRITVVHENNRARKRHSVEKKCSKGSSIMQKDANLLRWQIYAFCI